MSTEKKRVLEETTKLRGFRYGLHHILAEIDVESLKELNNKVYTAYLRESLPDGRPRNCSSWRLASPERTRWST